MNLDIESLKQLVTEWHKSQPSLPNDLIVTVTISLSGSIVTGASVTDKKMSVLVKDFFSLKNIQANPLYIKGRTALHSRLKFNYFSSYSDGEPMTMGEFIEKTTESELMAIPVFGIKCLEVLKDMLKNENFPALKEQ